MFEGEESGVFMIEARSLTRRFGSFTAVSQLSLNVPAGSVLALLGQNGAGKTTTVRMLSALLAPTEGEAFVNGYDVRKDPEAVRACVGLVTDVPGLFEQMSVRAYLDFFGELYGMPPSIRASRIDDLLEFFELSSHTQEKIVGFSKGMKQKVALARALIHEPAVLFLDEPTSGLDPLAAQSVRELILELKQTHRAIVLCTHDLDEAERLADSVAIMRQGQIVAHDTPAALRAQFSDETVVRIELAQPSPLSLEILSAIDGLHTPQFSAAPSSGVENTLLAYRTPYPVQINPQLVTRLSDAGALIISVTCQITTLEEVYTLAMHQSAERRDSRNAADRESPSQQPLARGR